VLAAGATEDEMTGVLLAIAPVAGLGRVVGAVTDVAVALGSGLIRFRPQMKGKWFKATEKMLA
jgi:hypothetical protein